MFVVCLLVRRTRVHVLVPFLARPGWIGTKGALLLLSKCEVDVRYPFWFGRLREFWGVGWGRNSTLLDISFRNPVNM